MKKINIKTIVLALLCAVMLSGISVISYADAASNASLAQLYEQIAAQGGNDQISATDAKALAQYYAALAKQEGKGATPSTSTVDVASVTAKIMALQATYPDGTPWGNNTPYTTRSKYPKMSSNGKACQGFAYLVQDAAFGTKKYVQHKTGIGSYVRSRAKGTYASILGNSLFIPVAGKTYYPSDPDYNLAISVNNDGMWIPVYPDNTRIYDGTDPKINAEFEKIWSKLNVGDMIVDAYHAAVVLTKNDTGITVVEGNSNSSVRWGRYISKETLRVALYYVYSCQW